MSQSNVATFCCVPTNRGRTAHILQVHLLIRYSILKVYLKFYSVTSKNECLQHGSTQGERILFLSRTNKTCFKPTIELLRGTVPKQNQGDGQSESNQEKAHKFKKLLKVLAFSCF